MTKEQLIDALVGKMQAEHAVNTSDAEIERTLSQTVAPDFCIRWAKQFRNEGLLSLHRETDDIRYDYDNQAWIVNGRYQRCGHPDDMDCQCYGKEHAGELAPNIF